MSRRDSLWLAVLPLALSAFGCSKGAEQRRDTAAAPAAIGGANANPVDTGMAARTHDTAGMSHDTSRTAPKDSTRKSP